MTAISATTTTVSAPDGTLIGYHSLGSGPDLVIVHGAMQSGRSQRDLAEVLADDFRVHLVDRRGRGASGPYPSSPGTAAEVDDLRAVVSATGARRVLGISSGAIIAARVALADPSALDRLALFEPPLAIDGSVRLALIPRVEAAAARADWGTVLGLGMKLAEMGPPWMFRLPVPILAVFGRRTLTSAEGRAIAEALPVDFTIVKENADRIAEFAALAVPTLVMGGTASRPYLRQAVAAIATTVPGVRHVELAGLTHAATQNRAEYGRPDAVAPPLRDFFGTTAR